MKLKKYAVLSVAAAMLATGCNTDSSGKESPRTEIENIDEFSTTIYIDGTSGDPNLDGPQAPLPPSSQIPLAIQCQTRVADSQSEIVSDVLSHITIEKDFQGVVTLTVAPNLIAVGDETPEELKQALLPFIGVGGSVTLNPGVENVTLVFDRSIFPDKEDAIFVLGLTVDGTAIVDYALGSGVTAQSVGEGDQAIAAVSVTPDSDDLVTVIWGDVPQQVQGYSNIPTGFFAEGDSIRSDYIGIENLSVAADFLDTSSDVGCSTAAGATQQVGDGSVVVPSSNDNKIAVRDF